MAQTEVERRVDCELEKARGRFREQFRFCRDVGHLDFGAKYLMREAGDWDMKLSPALEDLRDRWMKLVLLRRAKRMLAAAGNVEGCPSRGREN